ncbi:creatininase family protein [Natronosalvus rutilus]|uniref:Creatininase family protein n=1 Tax=Natronosalvus rutilus TaxID=2953753 RepID=A0A9E7NDV3_9EURY|nr:creatininase family protein [Natronosalvus rutilus]UTF55681.1 creatininase family protein [Natronosalvus rutilus]
MYECFGSQPTAWAGKTAAEIKAIAEEDGSILVLPVGSIEQHGPHLPVSTDTICADALAHEGAKLVMDEIPILIGPAQWAGNSPYHVGFPGRIDVTFSKLVEFYEEMASSALETGFDALLFLNGHGGNHNAIGGASKAIGLDHPDIEVLAITYFGLAADFIDEIRDSKPGGMNHAGELETSIMMHLRPDLVRGDLIEGANLDEPYTHAYDDMFVGGPLSVHRLEEEYSENGAVGNPEFASAEKGKEIFEKLCTEMRILFEEIYEQNAN